MADPQLTSMQSIRRTALVLKALSEGPSRGLRLSDVSTAVELSKTTALRLLKALMDVGYVDYDEAAKCYRLGYELFALGISARRFHIIELARPGLARLAEATEDTVFLSVRDGDQALCADRCTGSYPIRTLTLSVGDRRPLGVGAGSLALLAFENPAEIDRILEATRRDRLTYAGHDDETMTQLIGQTQRTGHSYNDGRIVGAMNAVGVPVLDANGRVVAALSIAAIRERMTGPRRSELVALLIAEAEQLGRALGSRDMERMTGGAG
ncbi:IclR family transcriptional regulator [Sedimentitalea sp. JM2-8]|uniref:IclR family transcriptional regulator n=1 Tax=Sedimentitalea xiamensis TaxID=3050037 RepID=A0ABT7FIU6_9RHOB|nr:IclR family transcriptional regulator [Sedimentitalea xiamensis]MDK3074714.1 IclR family transcriptional regulator [Sedimentitalea xiamensis]